MLALTQEGRRSLESLGVKISRGNGRGGLEHQYWVKEIALWARSLGTRCQIEDESRGVRVDLVIELESQVPLAVEVETSPGHELENVRKDRSAGLTRIVSLIKQPARIAKVQRDVEALTDEFERDATQIEVGRLTDFRQILGRFVNPNALVS